MPPDLKPDDELTVTVNNLETKYVSRKAYDATRAELGRLKIEIEYLYDLLENIRFFTCQAGSLKCPICDADTLLGKHDPNCALMLALAKKPRYK